MIDVLQADEGFIFVNKPSGILTHRTMLSPERETMLQRVRNQLGQWVYPLHRLDRATSGVLGFARSPEMAALLQPLFERREMKKNYRAIVRGWPPEGGTIDRELRDLEGSRMRTAVSHFSTLAHFEWSRPHGRYPAGRFALVEVRPETGRSHQIRRHLRGIDHPVINDSAHGDTRINRYFREEFGVGRLLLHALSLEFVDPRDGARRFIQAPYDAEWIELCQRFNWPTSCDPR